MKELSELTKEDFIKAAALNESETKSEYVDVEGFTFKKINMSGEEYAKQRGAIAYTESKIYSM